MFHDSVFVLLVAIGCTSGKDIKTSIGTKTLFQRDKHPIAEAPQTFAELTMKSNVFVDKSLLIKEILDDRNRLICITRPRHWGKSMNLDMLKTFFKLDVDERGNKIYPSASHPAYLLFVKGQVITKIDEDDRDYDDNEDDNEGDEDANKLPPLLAFGAPLLISKHQRIVDKFLGRHPVIYLDFSDFSGDNFQQLMGELKKRIIYAFESHAYLAPAFNAIIKQPNTDDSAKRLAQERLYWYNDIISTDRILSKSDLRVSVKTLVEALRQHFNATVFVLIDGYDVPFISLFSNNNLHQDDRDKFLTFYSTFLASTFKKNASIEKAILTGVFPIPKEDHESTLNAIKLYDLRTTKYQEYYGFHQHEVRAILQQLNMLRTEKNLPFHYQCQPNTSIVYNPSSIVYHLSKNPKQLFDVKRLENIVRFFSAANETKYSAQLVRAFDGTGAAIQRGNLDDGHFSRKELQLLHKAMEPRTYSNVTEIARQLAGFQVDELTDKLLLLLYTIGYLSLAKCESKFNSEDYTCVKVCNEQMTKRMLCVIRSYGRR